MTGTMLLGYSVAAFSLVLALSALAAGLAVARSVNAGQADDEDGYADITGVECDLSAIYLADDVPAKSEKN